MLTVKKILPSEIEVFNYVIIVMACVFILFHVVTVTCNGGSCFELENVQHCN